MATMRRPDPAKITIETRDMILTATSPNVGLEYSAWNTLEHMEVYKPYDVKITTKKEEAPVPPEAWNTDEPALNNDQKQGLANILIRAKQIERQQFMNARAVQGAILEAQKLTAEAEHKFNLSVLEALHTGLSQEDVELHLFTAGFTQLENRVESVHLLDTGLLYEAAE